MIRSFIYNSVGWLQETLSSRLQNAVLAILASGPIPKHVAFVMDGNRRYARRRHEAVFHGHSQGFVALRRVRGRTRSSLLLSYQQVSYVSRCWRYACA